MRSLWLVLACGLGSASAAQDQGVVTAMQKLFELPSHLLLSSVIANPDNRLSEFETDGCSGGMSWSWRVVSDIFPDFKAVQGAEPPWEACCVVHDRVYHDAGGTSDADASFDARLAADQELRQCVANPPQADIDAVAAHYEVTPDRVRFAYGLIGDSMFNAVRYGGAPCSALPWRWGFGYPACIPGL